MTGVLAEVIHAAVAPLARRALFAAVLALTIVLSLAFALGFAAAGLYLVVLEQLRLSGAVAAFIVAGVFAAVAVVVALWLRYRAARHDASGAASTAVEDIAARTMATRPVATLAACVAAGVIVSILGAGPRR